MYNYIYIDNYTRIVYIHMLPHEDPQKGILGFIEFSETITKKHPSHFFSTLAGWSRTSLLTSSNHEERMRWKIGPVWPMDQKDQQAKLQNFVPDVIRREMCLCQNMFCVILRQWTK